MQPDYRTLFEAVPGILLAVSPALEIAAASKLFLFIAKEDSNSIHNKPLEQVNPFNHFDKEQLALLKDTIQTVFTSAKSTTVQYRSTTGSWNISFSAVANEHSETTYVILHIEQPVTGIEPGQLSELEETITHLKEANKIKDEFLTNVAHDLRAPMHIISGYAQIVLSDCGDTIDSGSRQYLEHIKNKATGLGELVSGLLAYAKVQACTPRLADTDMRETALGALAVIKENCKNFNATIETGKLPTAVCDKELLHQVWYHLLSNAVKYSAPKPAPVIEIGYGNINGVDAYYVKDNGIGFDPDYGHKLFHPFERLHNQDDYPGAALGLAFVRQAIEKQGGKVGAQSIENESATFYFTLP